jgi:cell wall-associated NlpC family hydrolase
MSRAGTFSERLLLPLLGAWFALCLAAHGDTPATVAAPEPPAPTVPRQASLSPADLADFAKQPAAIQALLSDALALTHQGLTYQYGSADPASGGMDCSGTVHYVLRKQGLADVPRQADELYAWVRKAGLFQAVVATRLDSFELDALRPGDLLFWSGTYEVDRVLPVTHVMIYLGREAKNGNRVMFGASEGRRYGNNPRAGVSVFDFVLPSPHDKSRFLGYGPAPGLATGKPNP